MGCSASVPRSNQRKASLGNKRAASSAAFAQLRDVSTLNSLYDLSSSWTLGEGGQGAVCSVTQRLTGATYAMKTASAEDSGSTLEELERSIVLQASLDHPNIARIFDAFIDRKWERVHFTMQLCSGGTLSDRLNKIMVSDRLGRILRDESAAAQTSLNMVRAVHYCHQHGVVHCDIKLDNFLYDSHGDEAELKLIDFGFAKTARPDNDSLSGFDGTLPYMAPEIFRVAAGEQRCYRYTHAQWVACRLHALTSPLHARAQRSGRHVGAGRGGVRAVVRQVALPR